jgi:hypothetical protein
MSSARRLSGWFRSPSAASSFGLGPQTLDQLQEFLVLQRSILILIELLDRALELTSTGEFVRGELAVVISIGFLE